MCFHRIILLIAVFAVSACDDLDPSADDNRPVVDVGTIGPAVGQIAPDFALFDTLEAPVSLVAELSTADAVVLYFTMWCPVCDSHMSHMRSEIIPQYPAVKFFLVDYVSGSIEVARSAQLDNGYASSTVLVDTDQYVQEILYVATMGTTVVIDAGGIVRMNEDYKDGSRLVEVLNALPALP